MLTYRQLREKFANNDYADLYDDLYLEWQMYGHYESIEEMVKDDSANGGCQDVARCMCEDFPERYEF